MLMTGGLYAATGSMQTLFEFVFLAFGLGRENLQINLKCLKYMMLINTKADELAFQKITKILNLFKNCPRSTSKHFSIL
jgi:hypothetical protein